MLIILIFIAVLHISANPLPASSTDLAVSGDSLPIDTDSVITDNLPDGGCNGDNASTESLNGTVNPGLSILQRHSFQKRSTRSCPANILNPYGQPSGSNRYTKWRAPSEEELPVLDAYDIFSPWGNPKGKCKDKFKLTLLTCGGPEVWYKEILGFVLNCVLGKFFFFFVHSWINYLCYGYFRISKSNSQTRAISRCSYHQWILL